MRYHTAASDLLHPDDPGQFASPFFKGQAANLTNATQTPLAFRLVTPDPFVLLSTEPGSGKGRTPLAAVSRGDQLIGLPPQKNLQVRWRDCPVEGKNGPWCPCLFKRKASDLYMWGLTV